MWRPTRRSVRLTSLYLTSSGFTPVKADRGRDNRHNGCCFRSYRQVGLEIRVEAQQLQSVALVVIARHSCHHDGSLWSVLRAGLLFPSGSIDDNPYPRIPCTCAFPSHSRLSIPSHVRGRTVLVGLGSCSCWIVATKVYRRQHKGKMGIDGEYLWGISDLSGGGRSSVHGIYVEVEINESLLRSVVIVLVYLEWDV